MQIIPLRLWFVLLPLATGGGLVVYILTKISLPFTVAGVFLAGLFLAALAWQRTRVDQRQALKHRALVGAGGGLVGIIVYDTIRLLMVKVFHYRFWPFDILRIFGQALIGPNASHVMQTTAGVLFHATNGMAFGIAFVMICRRPTIWQGIVWGLFLECCMVSLYPGWLHVKFMQEFLSVSIVGHLAFGLTLGSIAQKYLSRGTGADIL